MEEMGHVHGPGLPFICATLSIKVVQSLRAWAVNPGEQGSNFSAAK